MFWKCNSTLQFNGRDCVQRVKKVNLDNFINSSRKPQLKIGLCGTKTKLKQFINLEIMVLKKSNVKWDPESRQDVDSMYDLISITAIL